MTLLRPTRVDMTPDQNGLFTIEQVTVLAAKRGLLAYSTDSDIICEVQHSTAGQQIQVVATTPGLWGSVEILKKCREALGKRWHEVGDTKRCPHQRHLDEVLIASVIGADGINPYLTRKTEHFVCHLEGADRFWLGLNPTLFTTYIRTKFPEYFGQIRVIAQAGDWTLPMLYVMCQSQKAGDSPEYRRALYAPPRGRPDQSHDERPQRHRHRDLRVDRACKDPSAKAKADCRGCRRAQRIRGVKLTGKRLV